MLTGMIRLIQPGHGKRQAVSTSTHLVEQYRTLERKGQVSKMAPGAGAVVNQSR